MVLGKRDGSTIGGHLRETHGNPMLELPTLELPTSVDPVPLAKKPDAESGMKFIDPTQ